MERALEVYKRMRSSKVAGTAECYTAAVHACSQKGYLEFALSIYEDMKKDGVRPDEVHILWCMRFMFFFRFCVATWM